MTGRPADSTIHQQLGALLAADADAIVSVFAPMTFEVPVVIPEALGLADRRLIDPLNGIALLDSRDHATIFGFPVLVPELGIVRGRCHFADGSPAEGVLFDVSNLFGVYVFVLSRQEAERVVEPSRPPKLAARIGRYRADSVGHIVSVDPSTTEILGWTVEAMAGIEGIDLIHPEDRSAFLWAWASMLGEAGAVERVRTRFAQADGNWRWVEATFESHIEDDETVHVEILDISKEMAAEDELRTREHLLRRLAEALPVGVVLLDANHTVVYTNRAMAAITGRESAGSLIEQLQDVTAEDGPRLRDAIDQVLGTGIDGDIEITVEDKTTGHHRICGLTMRALVDHDNVITGAVACLSDVTDSAGRRRELEAAATFDPLTGSYNRTSTLSALQLALERPRSSSSGCALFFVDVDEFKLVNDNLGHVAGDELLVEIAQRLRAVTRTSDVVGRFGGDEFIVVCADIVIPEVAEELGHRINEQLRRPLTLAGRVVTPSASIGCAWTIATDLDAKTLLERADAAMYDAKRNQTRQVHVWDETVVPAGDDQPVCTRPIGVSPS